MGLLSETLALQREAFKIDPSTLDGDALREYLVWNLHALMVEGAEATQELAWKPWKNYDDGQVFSDDCTIFSFSEEVIDCLHFVANLLVALGYDDDSLLDAWREKANVNRARQDRERHGG